MRFSDFSDRHDAAYLWDKYAVQCQVHHRGKCVQTVVNLRRHDSHIKLR